MSNGFIAFIFALGSAGFVYSKISRMAGNGNGRVVAISTGLVFLFAYFFLFTLMKYVLHF